MKELIYVLMNLPETGSFHTVDKRIETVGPRLNDAYSVCAVDAGVYKEGQPLRRRETSWP